MLVCWYVGMRRGGVDELRCMGEADGTKAIGSDSEADGMEGDTGGFFFEGIK
jgi:hypothetical protein